MKQQQRIKNMKDLDEENLIKRKNGRWKPMLAADCEKVWIHPGLGRHHAEVV